MTGLVYPVRFGGFCCVHYGDAAAITAAKKNKEETLYENKDETILGILLMLALAMGLLPGMGMTAYAADGDTTYTITIPSTLTVSGKQSRLQGKSKVHSI